MEVPLFFSIVIVSLNGGRVIGRALDSVRRTDYPAFEVIVVDNGSTDDLAEVVRRDYPEVRLIRAPVNLGFAGGNNLGIREAQGDAIVLLNDDTEVRPGWLKAWAKAASEHPRWGVLGAKLLYPDGRTIQHAGGRIQPNGQTYHFGYEQEDDGRFDRLIPCDYVTGACIALRRETVSELGLLDEKYFPIYFEETDYCWQVRRVGYEVLYVPDAVVVHHESRTQGRYSFRFVYRYTRCRIRFLLKCFSKEDLVRALVAELRWWFRRQKPTFYLPYLWAYLHGLVYMPFHLRDRFPFHRRLESLSDKIRAQLASRTT
ncbi:glycosyltransferase family 2 protein [Candidatus Sumerlaeota bacterium]|nr:glycosyltransferase family 2 protein [Candidatus Sumerlaeota bacterium]